MTRSSDSPARATFSFDADNALCVRGEATASQCLRVVSTAIEQFITAVKCHGRPKRSAYQLPRKHDDLLVLWERAVALASFAGMSVARDRTPEESTTFEEAGVVAYEVTVDRNKLPIDGALGQVEFMLPRNEHGDWVERVPVEVVERLERGIPTRRLAVRRLEALRSQSTENSP